jgi:tetratricopeptide (TPR) repeat protein
MPPFGVSFSSVHLDRDYGKPSSQSRTEKSVKAMRICAPIQVFVLGRKLRLGWMTRLGIVMTLTAVAFAPAIQAQSSSALTLGGQASIRGTVMLPDGSPISEAVKVTLKVLRGDQATVYTDQQGRFELRNLTSGDYTLEIEADRNQRFEVTTERVTVQRNAPMFVTIYLKEKKSERRAVSDRTVSVAMLDQKVPAAAKREFEKAVHLSSQGRLDESTEALRRALAIYPEYLMARNDLGAHLMEQGRLDEAKEQLLAAVKIDPNAFNAQLNLGIVLVRQNKFGEALVALNKALTLEPSAPAVHLYAGMACTGVNNTERGEKELRSAYDLGGAPYAVALVHLGRLYMQNGDREMALKTFETYLRESPDGANAAQVQKMIAILHQ